MMRNDSASVISSLQMDYADSDEEESDSKNTSKSNLEEEQVVAPTEPVKSDPDVDGKSTVKLEPESLEMSTDIEKGNENLASEDIKSEVKEEIETFNNDVKKEPEISPAELISDDEDSQSSHSQQHHNRHQHQRHYDRDSGRKQAFAEAVNTDSPSSQSSLKAGRKATRLVSYGPDEDVDGDDSSSEEEEAQEPSGSNSPELNAADASILSRSVQNMASDDIKIPPEPTGKCAYQLQKKIEDMYERMRREGLDLNRVIQSKKNFRNPSIYEKLIDFCHIDEKGTNFPPDIYDPHLWGKESYYDELDKAQRKDMERREKEKKERTKIEFMTGTKKSAPSSDGSSGPSDEKKRKTKWDAQPPGMIHVAKVQASGQNPGVVNLTAMATGTKNTVISALGTLSKKPSSLGK